CAAACFAAGGAGSPAASKPAGATTQKGFIPAFKAIAYYDDSCRRCHGPQGSFYDPELGKGLTDKQLMKIVDDMANGPGQSPLTPDQLEIETAFHRALVAGTPYLSVTALEPEKISGEVMPEAKVTLTAGKKTLDAKVEDSAWSVALPAGTK